MEIINKTIPRGWQRLALSDVSVKLKTGGTPTSNNRDFYTGSIPFVKIDDMTTSGHYILKTKTHINEDALKNSSAWIVPADSILYSIYATVGEVAINKVDLATNQAIVGIIPDDNKVNRNFLYYYLIYIKLSLSRFFKETTQKNLTTEIVKKLEVLVPPLNEQKKIAEILSTVDDEIQKTDEIISQTEKLKKGLIQKLFTKGIEHKKFKKTEIGILPETWDVNKLGEIVIFENGKAHENHISTNGTYVVVNSKFISSDGSVAKFTDNNLKPLKKGDITVVMSDVPNGKAIGKCFIVPENDKYTLNQRIGLIRPKNGVPEFFFHYLNRNKYFLSFDNGVGQTNLRKDEVLNCPIAIPPISEQRKIVDILSSVDGKILINKNLKEKLSRLKKGLMQDLLSGKVRTKKIS